MQQGQQDRPLLRQLIDASSVGLLDIDIRGFAIGYFLDRFLRHPLADDNIPYNWHSIRVP